MNSKRQLEKALIAVLPDSDIIDSGHIGATGYFDIRGPRLLPVHRDQIQSLLPEPATMCLADARRHNTPVQRLYVGNDIDIKQRAARCKRHDCRRSVASHNTTLKAIEDWQQHIVQYHRLADRRSDWNTAAVVAVAAFLRPFDFAAVRFRVAGPSTSAGELKRLCSDIHGTGYNVARDPGRAPVLVVRVLVDDILGREWHLGNIRPNSGVELLPPVVAAALQIITAGWLPLWCTPTLLRVLPVAVANSAAAEKLWHDLCTAEINCDIDDLNERLGAGIRRSVVDRIPYTAIVGTHTAAGQVAVRRHDGEDLGTMTIRDVTEFLRQAAAPPQSVPLKKNRGVR